MTSPIASESTLPCSLEIKAANFSLFVSNNALKANITRARLSGEVFDQAGKACSAAMIAAVVSASSLSTTCLVCSPVAGLNTGEKR